MAASTEADGFDLRFRAGDGVRRCELAQAAEVAFETLAPVRSFPAFRGQRNNTGWWWVATTARHVGYESWLERDHLIRLDFTPRVVGIASQPFWLSWPEGAGRRSHVPDYFARLADGTGIVIDCRPRQRVGPRDAAAFAATERACAQLGWRYQLAHELPATRMANLRWLAGYRHPRYRRGEVAADAVQAATAPLYVLDLAQRLGDPIGTLPVLFHLLWSGELDADLSLPLHGDTMIVAPGASSD
ncbi:TnsA-like heteromeric transposase endonuclease subunit [Amycolatopsis sp. NPDC049688]|uniref:TnsA-like heteromeric transposase endonuclease subunit n=1 Tax=Amycolatopsis sp. NPDC049688 TaxID=3154733 RepID=UPI003447CD63